jgi:hypothetical protein
MRYLLLAVVFVELLSSCSHDNPVDPTTPTDPPIPAEERVTTQISGFVTTPDNSFFNNTLVYSGATNWTLTNGIFLTDNINSDKYATRITLNDPLGVEKRKTITLTPAAINYVRLKPIKMESPGQFTNGQGGTFSYAGTGNIVFPANSIYQTATGIYPGYYGPDIQANVSIGYLNPLSTDFGVSLPCYSFADDNNKRVFLASLGVVAVSGGWINPLSDANSIDLFTNYTATLKVPIPANLPSPAPDSISLWRLNQGRWIRSGIARKTGNVYTAIISKLGTYNLANPVNGVYKTIRLRTSNNTPVINATVKIKYNQAVIAESQTDWQGNAFVYLPADQNLNAELYQVWWNTQIAYTGPINTTGTNPNIDITVNSTSDRIYQFKGNAYSCDGTPVVNGKITLYNIYTGVNYYIPVTNGTFNSAIVHDDGTGYVFTAKLTNLGNNVSGVDTAIVPLSGTANSYNLNTCPLSTNLYMNFSIDGGVTAGITGDMSNSFNPYLNALQSNNETMVIGDQSPKSLQFSTHAIQAGVYTGSGIDELFVNGTHYFYDFNKPMRVSFDRYDLLPGGFVIGSADFYYKDQAGVSHHLLANFKVKRFL